MKGYKGFDKDLKCRGFQYEFDKDYETDGAILCDEGFHFCEDPIDCFKYYSPAFSKYAEIDAAEVSDEKDPTDSKRVAKKIHIGAEINAFTIVKAHIDYVKSRVTESVEKGDSESVSVGSNQAATAGTFGAATAGDFGAATAGNFGAATAGDSGAATAGNSGAATAGDSGAATAGNSGAATSRGSSASGKNGLSVARGNGVKVKGGMGAVLVIVKENEDNYDISEWKAAVVDGNAIKEDTWYELIDGEFKEVIE